MVRIGRTTSIDDDQILSSVRWLLLFYLLPSLKSYGVETIISYDLLGTDCPFAFPSTPMAQGPLNPNFYLILFLLISLRSIQTAIRAFIFPLRIADAPTIKYKSLCHYKSDPLMSLRWLVKIWIFLAAVRQLSTVNIPYSTSYYRFPSNAIPVCFSIFISYRGNQCSNKLGF